MSSFGIIELLQRSLLNRAPGIKKRDLPKFGHGGTLDPFATGLLVVCVGEAVKLTRYFLGSEKTYEGVIRFGETTVPGDPTAEISERTERVPASVSEIRETAHKLTLQPYLQTPPMHSAKKKDGKPLYELARQGIEIEREPRICHLRDFEIGGYEDRRASFRVSCSSGTYIRVLAQDLGRMHGSVAMLDSLRRTASGTLSLEKAMTTDAIIRAAESGTEWSELPCWVPFSRLMDAYPGVEASRQEALELRQGKQAALQRIVSRSLPPADAQWMTVRCEGELIAVAAQNESIWSIERVFISDSK